ncbi:MAG: SdpI family protein [Bacteroidota bacterium]
MKKFTYIDATALIVWLLPIAYLFSIYNALPQIVPLHYGADGKVNRYGDKSELIMATGVMLFVGALVYLLLKFLPAIDPKKKVKYGEETFRKIAFGILLFVSALNIAILYVTGHRNLPIDKIMLPIAGLLFTFMGNMMNNIKPNYFAGVRTPWTLESEDTWRATHRLAGKLWFTGGLVITAATLMLPSLPATIVFGAGVLALTLIPVIYSYVYFKNHQPQNNS